MSDASDLPQLSGRPSLIAEELKLVTGVVR
jgi:hypothetical protein